MTKQDLDKTLKEIRKEIFLTGYSVNIAHLASAFSLVEILYSLYHNQHLHYDPKNPDKDTRDRFILSKGHGSLALYVMLAREGIISQEQLASFCKPGSSLGGEPVLNSVPGIEATSGSLGHGLSLGAGMALAKKLDHRSEKVYVLLGDGECQEGAIWEAVMFAAAKQLDNLIAIIDDNALQKMGKTSDIMGITSWAEQFKAFNWDVQEVDGHDVTALDQIFAKPNTTKKPRAIIAHTIKGKGVSIVEGDARWHWRLPSKRELKTFVQELNISEEEIASCRPAM